MCCSQVIYSMFFNYRFRNGRFVTATLKTQVTKIFDHINVSESKLKYEN